jgi:hypothetical protein
VFEQLPKYTNTHPSQSTDDAWYRLRLFSYFRGALALFFITIYFNGWLQQLVHNNNENTLLFITTSFF